MTEILPLFSNKFKDIINQINEKYDSKIASWLLNANSLIEGYSYIQCREMLIHTDYHWYAQQLHQFHVSEIEKYINDSVRMLDVRYNEFEISFLPKGKDAEYNYEYKWTRKNRQSGKPTKIIKKLINTKKFSDKEYELFNNQLRSIIEQSGSFEIVSGKDIRKWYHGENYYSSHGSLANSCMKHESCQEFFKVYEKYAKMLIFIKDDKLAGRAIIWEINGNTYMDRVYVCMDYLENTFIEYAQSNKWYHRINQDMMESDETMAWYGPNDDYLNAEELILEIKVDDIDTYPYMDTFRYYRRTNNYNIISTDSTSCYDNLLCETNGFLDNIEYTCDCCGETIHAGESVPNGMVYSTWDDCYYCDDCSVYSEIMRSSISAERSIPIHIDIREMDYIDPSFDCSTCEINNEYYLVTHPNVMYNEKTNEYYLKNE